MNIMSENIGTLRYRVQESIQMPATVSLAEGDLSWHVTYKERVPFEEGIGKCMAPRPVEGCLQDFLSLTHASDEEVLGFVERRGVLGIFPLVEGKFSDASDGETNVRYTEPVQLYRGVASRANILLNFMHDLRKGAPIDAKDPRWREINPYDTFESASGSRDAMLEILHFAVQSWWSTASPKLFLSDFNDMSNAHVFDLYFGDWGDGRDFDKEWLARAAALQGDHQTEREASNYRLGARAAHRMFTTEISKILPFDHQRPSPLFNVLAVQLTEAVSLPEGSHFCSQCDKLYQYDPDKAGEPRDMKAAKDTKAWGNSKPRKGRGTAFCSEWCRKAFDAADNRRRYQERRRPAERAHPLGE